MSLQEKILHDTPVLRLADNTVYDGSKVQILRSWDSEEQCLNIVLTNTGSKPLQVREIVFYSGSAPYAPDTRFYGEGYHMLTQYRGSLEHPELIGAYGTDREFFRFPDTPFTQGKWIVYNLMMFFPQGQQTELVAFGSCNRFMGEFRFTGDYLELVMDTECLTLDPGESWRLEELFMETGYDHNRLLSDLARAIHKNHPRREYPEIPTGWCSYYCLRPMTVDGLVEQSRAMAEKIPELKRIQIDGGYEAYDGDWLVAHPRLGADMKTICRRIFETGMQPAGYISPFLGQVGSALLRNHPDWFVQDEEGKPFNKIGHKENWYMLDGSNPAACQYLYDITKVMREEWGIRYFKLDFLSYGALPGGKRYDPKMTRVQSFRRAIQAIVEAAGEDSFILGCNAPFWPILGLCHGNRVTNDIARDWKHVSGNAVELFYRNWQNNRLWYNDPDVVVLEPIDLSSWRGDQWVDRTSKLTPAEFEFHKAFVVASGGMILSGDLLTQLSEQSLNCLKRLIPAAGVAAVFDNDRFEYGWVQLPEKKLLCLFNWEQQSKTLSIPLEGRYQVSDFWTDEELGQYSDSLSVEMQPHGGRVLVLQESR